MAAPLQNCSDLVASPSKNICWIVASIVYSFFGVPANGWSNPDAFLAKSHLQFKGNRFSLESAVSEEIANIETH